MGWLKGLLGGGRRPAEADEWTPSPAAEGWDAPEPPPARQGSHDCAKDHIDSWPDRSCEFGEDERRVRLLFRPCSHNPGTLVVHMELEGKVYDDMRREMGDTKIVSRATGNGYRYEFKEVSTHVTYLPVVCSVLLGMTVTSIAYLRFTSTPRA